MSHIFISYAPKDYFFARELSEYIHEQLGLNTIVPDYQVEFFAESLEQFLPIPEEAIQTSLLFLRLETSQLLNSYTNEQELKVALQSERPILCLTSLGTKSPLVDTNAVLIEASLDQLDNMYQIQKSIEYFLMKPFIDAEDPPPDLDSFLEDQYDKLQQRLDQHKQQAQIDEQISYTVVFFDDMLVRGTTDDIKDIHRLLRAQMYLHNFKPDQAEQICQDILRTSTSDLDTTVHVYKILGDIQLFSANYDGARQFFKQAISIAKNKLNSCENIQVYALMQIGNTYRYQARYPHARNYLDQAYQQAWDIHELPLICDTLGYLGKLTYSQGELDAAKVMLRQALVVANKLGSQERRSRYLRHLGRIYDKQSLIGISEKCYEKSLQISITIDDPLGQCSTLRYLGLLHLKQNDIDTATLACQQALTIAQKLHHPRTEIRTLCSLGSIFYVQKECDQAIDLFMQAFSIANRFQLRLEKAYIVACLARIMLTQLTIAPTKQKLQDAFCSFQQSIGLLEQVNQSYRLFSEHRLTHYTQIITQLFQQLQHSTSALGKKSGTRRDTNVGGRLEDLEEIYQGLLEDYAAIDDVSDSAEAEFPNENLRRLQDIYDDMIRTIFDEQGLNCYALIAH